VPADLALKVLINALENSPAQKYIIRDFPSTVDQATKFEELVKAPEAVLYFKVESDVCEKRQQADQLSVFKKCLDIYSTMT
jgi:adenylate kinase family enzyme